MLEYTRQQTDLAVIKPFHLVSSFNFPHKPFIASYIPSLWSSPLIKQKRWLMSCSLMHSFKMFYVAALKEFLKERSLSQLAQNMITMLTEWFMVVILNWYIINVTLLQLEEKPRALGELGITVLRRGILGLETGTSLQEACACWDMTEDFMLKYAFPSQPLSGESTPCAAWVHMVHERNNILRTAVFLEYKQLSILSMRRFYGRNIHKLQCQLPSWEHLVFINILA